MIPSITEDDIAAVTEVLRSGMLIQGKHVQSLEDGFKNIVGTSDALAVSNGTATMHLTLLTLGIGIGDEVIVPAFSYVATANVVEMVGATPVFVDIDMDTFNIDITKIENAITGKTKAIIPVHEFGLSAEISAIKKIADKHKLWVIEDAACALGAKENEKSVGSFGIASSFSLHPRKSITSGEGGIIATNDKDLAKKLSILRNHGIEMKEGKMDFVEAGYNYRLTDFQAAFANSQLRRLDNILAYKQELADVYFEELDGDNVQLPTVPENKNHTWQTYHIVLDDKIDRDVLIAKLREEGIGTNYGAQCIPATTFYTKKYGHDSEKSFPNAWRAYTKGLAIPLYFNLTKEDIRYISTLINKTIHEC